jgi:hypothetical protein
MLAFSWMGSLDWLRMGTERGLAYRRNEAVKSSSGQTMSGRWMVTESIGAHCRALAKSSGEAER